MSKIRLYGSTSGYTELVPNAIAGDNAITFPNTVGEVVVTDSSGNLGNIKVNSINSGPLAGFRNAIINGNFDIWQRATTYTGSLNPFVADRWTSNGTAKEVDRRSFTLGQTEVPGNPTYYLEFALTDTTSNSPHVQQSIEGVRTFAGEEVTLSFWCKAVGSGFNLTVEYQQNFGTGGAPSLSTVTNAGTTALTTSWAKYTVTTTLPSISGKTLGLFGNDCLRVRFKPPASTICEFQIAQVQLESGPVATPFERRPIETELALCQRYYCKSYNSDVTPGTITTDGRIYTSNAASGAGTIDIPFSFPVFMRVNPTITAYNPVTGAANSVRRGSSNVTPSITSIGHRGAAIGGGGTSADNVQFHYTADSEL